MSSVGASLTGPDTLSSLRIKMTVSQREVFNGVVSENMKKKKELPAVRGSKW